MGGRARWLLTALVAGLVATATATTASAEPGASRDLCTHRDDRPDLGAPVQRQRGGGGGIQHRLRQGTHVKVLRTEKGWLRIRYTDPGPPVRSEPLRYEGWLRDIYLRPCPDPTPEKRPTARAPGSTVKLCWWNAKRLGHGKRDWDASARAVRGCDVVGLGEDVPE